jgi:hypothetical protein
MGLLGTPYSGRTFMWLTLVAFATIAVVNRTALAGMIRPNG